MLRHGFLCLAWLWSSLLLPPLLLQFRLMLSFIHCTGWYFSGGSRWANAVCAPRIVERTKEILMSYMCICREPLVLQVSDGVCICYAAIVVLCTYIFYICLLFLVSCICVNMALMVEPTISECTVSLSDFISCITRVSASWQQPFCTSSSWHHSAGFSQRLGSPTWQWRERFGPGSSASVFCVWAGVSEQCVLFSLNLSIISHHTSQLPFSLKESSQGVFPSNYMFSVRCSHPLCGAARSSTYQVLCCGAFVLKSGSLRAE